ncbi:peptidoglycan bridge formation glycyltransferase FemA/FemB family protein [Candidatus Saccharibacteria bacterium]|nr:peptidoglycan bridge formation glycyltransferase FemA/FemB family protein [Candidatus Saccharibacteria bacterium]
MQIIDAANQKQWDDFITSHPESNFLHSWAWGQFHLSRGKTIVRRLAIENDQIVAAYTGQVETAKRGRYLAIAGGPILDWTNQALVKTVFDDIAQQGGANHCVFVRIRPQLEESQKSEQLFKDLGLKPAPIYLSVEYAGVLDLHKTEEEILANASQRLRRAIRKAGKNNITISTSTDPKDIHEFYQIQLETARRHDFVSFSEDFLTKQFTAFAANSQVKLYTARYENQILAQNFIIFYGPEASYHYGVSTQLGTQLSGAPLLHMQAMRDAREQGIIRYNFWGITAEDDIKHRFYGVSQFKRGFGITELKYLHAHDLILKPAPYKLNHLIETARRRTRHV